MGYREIPEDRILKFGATSGFKGWKHFFTKESINHPAKMNLNLLRWILTEYTSPNDIVLDPMAGTGSTTILASTMGRNSIAVEYEAKFYKMIEENILRTRNHSTLTPKGKMDCIHGDARGLSKYVLESDIIVTSPPYSIEISPQGADGKTQDWNLSYREAQKTGDWEKFKNQMKKQKDEQGYSENGIDTIISSPPYGNRLADVAIKDADPARMGYRQAVDVVLTSPPYGSDNANLQGREDKSAKSILGTTGVRSVGLEPDNLGNLKYGEIDAVVTSPPYEAGPFNHAGGHGGAYAGGIAQRDVSLKPVDIGEENIGNLKGETYLEAMIQVYQECYNVLKPLGKSVLVTKNFIRDKQVVRLDLDTIKLCESIGFRLIDRWYFELPIRSFWKILYHKKYPDVDEVKYEDILVFEKPDVLVPPRGGKNE